MSLLTRSDLSGLKYQALQQLAKASREGLKANGKKDAIVNLLVRRYPDGIPRLQRSPPNAKGQPLMNDLSSSPRPSKKQRIGTDHDSTNESVRNWVQDVHHNQPSHLNSQSPSPRPDPPQLHPPRDRSPPPHVYCFKGARRVRRQLANLANEAAKIHGDLDETEALMQFAAKTCGRAMRKVEGFARLRRTMQTLYGTMKSDRTILDGTGNMDSSNIDAWRKHAFELDRLEKEQQMADDRRNIALRFKHVEEDGQNRENELEVDGMPLSSKRKHTIIEE